MRRNLAIIGIVTAAMSGVALAAPAVPASAAGERTTYRAFVAEATFSTDPGRHHRVPGEVYVDTTVRGVNMSNRQTGYAYRYLLTDQVRYSFTKRGRWVFVSERFGYANRNVSLDRDHLQAATFDARLRYRLINDESSRRLPAADVTATFSAVGEPMLVTNIGKQHTPGSPTMTLHEKKRLVDATLDTNTPTPGKIRSGDMFAMTSKSTCPPEF